MHRKLLLTILTIVLIASVTTSLVNAGGWSFDWDLGSLRATGWVSGLGSDDAQVTLTGYGIAYALCQNYGGNLAPGRNPISFTVAQVGIFYIDDNGRADVQIAAPDPTLYNVEPSPTPKTAGCPNENWTVVGFDTARVDWTAAHILVVDALTGMYVRHNLYFECDTYFDAAGVATDVDCWNVPAPQ